MARTVVITGGGTGGHVFPMQAIAEQLEARGWSPDELRFVGSEHGQDRRLLGGGAVPLTTLPGRGLRRSRRPRDVVANARAAVGLVVGLVRATVCIRKWRPAAVVSVGGYASFAVDTAAVCWRVPLILVNFDAVPGAVHRLFARFAAATCVAFGEDGSGVRVTGTPLRASIEAVARDDASRAVAKSHCTPPIEEERWVVVVMTGSLGSLRVNRAVSDLARRWSARTDVTLWHVTGRRDFDEVRAATPKLEGLDYRVEAFADMSILWAVADLAVCRAGAITVGELTTLAIPSVLVPLPGAPGDHQAHNARRMSDVGAAVVLPDERCTGEALADCLEPLMDRARVAAMSAAAATLARPHAAAAIARVVADVVS
ncbi:MAG: UDP-N-acetylglucosamine--N-acetylmuramyl-(pentapeptide) pyrophosphoryl-undecaprenol N-acetylglucosamine transferase [Acidobacteriota bacterium]|nr:UDP-N-acetylglucosamine--N-acetylmuramyl-(pentapeptide) pyrophosphoryl-undecaprenol N-acetylglucosamine transferase [Acidobacteriota bacterium]